MRESDVKVLIYMPFYSGECESRHALAERGKSRDSEKVWFNEIPFLKKYTEVYKYNIKTKASPKKVKINNQVEVSETTLEQQPVAVKAKDKLLVSLARRGLRYFIQTVKIISLLIKGDAYAPVFKLCRKRLLVECSNMSSFDVLHIVRPNKVSDQLIEIFKQKNPDLKVIIGPNLMAYGSPSNAFSFDQFSDPAITKVIAVSSYHKQLLEDFGFDNERLLRLPPSVHPKYFNPSIISTSRTDNTFTLFFAASQLSVEKGAEEFLLALIKIKKNSLFKFRAIVAGDFQVSEGVQTPLGSELIEAVSDYVEFVGSIKRLEMATYYSHVDVFVHCGEPENGPTTIIEALSCGTICLLTNYLCFKEPELEENCYFYNRGDVGELVDSLLEIQREYDSKGERVFLPECTHHQTIDFLSSVYENA